MLNDSVHVRQPSQPDCWLFQGDCGADRFEGGTNRHCGHSFLSSDRTNAGVNKTLSEFNFKTE